MYRAKRTFLNYAPYYLIQRRRWWGWETVQLVEHSSLLAAQAMDRLRQLPDVIT